MRYSDIHRRRHTVTPQGEPIAGRDMIPNAAGGYAFAVDPFQMLRRFLVTGTLGGTYYTSARDLTKQNVAVIEQLLAAEPQRVVDEVVAISEAGRGASNDPALFVLAMAMATPGAQPYAAAALPKVARIGTHLLHFAEYVEAFRGWGRSLREAVAGWYVGKSPDALAYQAAKYRQRDGWAHRDLLRLSHPVADSPAKAEVFEWICRRGATSVPVLQDFEALQAGPTEAETIAIVERGHVSWEMIPSELRTPDVWRALLPRLPLMTTVRNLGVLTANGVLGILSEQVDLVLEKLRDEEAIRKSRIHPIAILLAKAVYGAGHGLRGSLTWKPDKAIRAALDDAFYAAFGNVEPTGQRIMLAIDASGSMGYGAMNGVPMTCRAVAGALALVTARVEKRWHLMGYDTQPRELNITTKMDLGQVLKRLDKFSGGGTDCAVPLEWALANKVPVDLFVNLTDNETWAGHGHPVERLREYRERMGIEAKMVVVGMTATECSIADPDDPLMMDVAGFDAGTPELISEFARL